MMKRRNVLLVTTFLLLGSACQEGSIFKKEQVYTPVTLYFSPLEDYLTPPGFMPDFVNYPNDWVKWGLKGKVKSVTCKTLHTFSLEFSEDGRLLQSNFVGDGGGVSEGKQTLFHYNDSNRLESITSKGTFTMMGGRTSRFPEILDSKVMSYTPSGKIEKRSYYDFKGNKVVSVKQYQYDEKDICRGMASVDNNSGKKKGILDITANEQGRASDIYVPNLRIPGRLTIGERHIVPSYDEDGRMIEIKELAIPHNMEAYNMDSIRVENQYKYNDKGDIVEWTYHDIVYPGNRPNDFVCTFSYVYDDQGNWTSKTMTGGIAYLHSFMNSYYRGSYTINRVQSEERNDLGEVTLTREITYYDAEAKQQTN